MTKEEKDDAKAAKEVVVLRNGFALVDGHIEKMVRGMIEMDHDLWLGGDCPCAVLVTDCYRGITTWNRRHCFAGEANTPRLGRSSGA